ncbi:hypothetical protein [Marinobacter zhejiangensis]|uniref:Uncharacterized protein n=1 Tax=Marinobacter zhejiangensis TaxID=488535 RepID=A0A1I4PVV4_9GAMM|nr:hypothetical protein [Marinobacter zhejiangensis]SFM31972.1 hypothetical protein SAMN04487963_2022 [Marinobacter zhejiangensis]
MPTEENRPPRMGDGRVFFTFLLKHYGRQESHDETALRVLVLGRDKYGAERETLKGKHLRSWDEGTRIVPKWAYSAALELCLQAGFKPADEDQAIACWKSWRLIQGALLPTDQQLLAFSQAVSLTSEQVRAVQSYADEEK